METKYAKLIEQMERVTAAYNEALSGFLNLEGVIKKQSDVIGVSGGLIYLGDTFEKRRAIELDKESFTAVALDCGSDFSHIYLDKYTQFECTMLGYRVLTLVKEGSEEEALLLDLI